tara:strand:+ start:133 stop:477 length:345 start_codon:yes stop_codon:yes gene_type:complete
MVSDNTIQESLTFSHLLLEETDTTFQLWLIHRTHISKNYKLIETISSGDGSQVLLSLVLHFFNLLKENTQLVSLLEDRFQLQKLDNLVITLLFFFSLEHCGGNLRKAQELEDAT